MPVLTKINTNVIADNAITAAKTASSAEEESGLGLNTAATADLTGTISTQQFKLADTFTLTGDLTVNDDLILGKVRDDGTGQTLTHTAATNRTLTGTGTLTMGNYIEGQQVGVDVTTRVEGLSGTLGSGVTIPAAGVSGVLPVGVTGGSGLTALGTVASGILGSGVQLKVHYVEFESDTGTQANGYVFGSALTIASGDNPSGAKWLVISGGGRFLSVTTGEIYGTFLKYIENDDPVWSTTNGTLVTEILVPMQKYLHDDNNSQENGMRLWTYTNGGSAQKVEFKMSIYVSGGSARCYAIGTSGRMGILALRIH